MHQRSTPTRFIALLSLLLVCAAAPAVGNDGQLGDDRAAIQRYRQGMQSVRDYLDGHRLFAEGKAAPAIPSRADKAQLRKAWARYLDYTLALDALMVRYRNFRTASSRPIQQARFQAFYTAYLVQFREALDLLSVLERNRDTHILLNEAVPALGLAESSYTAFKRRFLHVQRAAEFAAAEPVLAYYGGAKTLGKAARDDRRSLIRYGFGDGTALTLRNGLQVVADRVTEAAFPVQAGVAEWLGDTRVYRVGQPLIDQALIGELQTKLQPGDVLLERREWYLSNIGLPGYWPHAAIYVGTAKERAAFFDRPAVRAWIRAQGVESGHFDALLAARHPRAAQAVGGEDGGHPVRVLEAVSEGVTLTALEHSAAADSVAVLRPQLDRLAIAQALLRAFAYTGRPYDFDFDFRTDSALVCTELVYKSYHPVLPFSVSRVAGRTVVSANDLARQYDADRSRGLRHWRFVAFLDGDERRATAAWRDEAAFRASWKRPKWHIVKTALDHSGQDSDSR